jgi:hypothetical protein
VSDAASKEPSTFIKMTLRLLKRPQVSGPDCTALKETSGEGKMKWGGNFIRHIEKNIKGMNMQGMCVYQEKEEERRKENEIKGDKQNYNHGKERSLR